MASSANLGQQLENYVNELVKSGRYNSRSEVLREGVRLVEEREKRLMALDLAIGQGIADAESGRFKPISDVAARLSGKYDDRS
ncbi:type II toxin-antitoxin system ParD family antitoxin [Rhizobium ruizarguesonis]|jgi:antitoxin ParD1/3/4|uniref:Putative addiction module antidote protein, CopG/Arc/MetJ family n=1 Tax=Rhizobium leguminosarum bv. trifolii (strain WSM1325) TaxID=395491 RepID=C6ATR9_RHILS|nr:MULTISPECIES: type II toxin-antitoxin system ParD family antitoxin [Rhizobium]ACS57411.1 putative addiction module antidote protein, CopG/Arc/MetJ family [Rhizobium leguminosarum bv. trifolii WSM1325]MBY2905829.1 type II toxin-antitoxin system ParD family antitoxin [Rhizobium leguminosarum]MBY2912848.1 type II toxin-antitoxin system ParD family antitoxin [Rhizobium leguminosarum]MBY2921403.1 type II toxin-antitoxin system ParD family antitoxin [Rhizobium leguminosarum]MBY2931441.1 type II t